MTRRLLMLFSLLVHVDFTKSGARQNGEANKIDDEETKRTQQINVELNLGNAQLRKQVQGKDVEIAKIKQELKESERERELFEEAVNKMVSWLEGEVSFAKEMTGRCEVEREQLETRIQMLDERLSAQILANKLMEIKLKNYAQVMDDMPPCNEILRRQLAETKQNICLPDSPTHDQVGGTCMNYATATWIRKTLTEEFLRDLPRHHEIVENLPTFQRTRQDQLESITKEAERWNLKVEQLDLSKEGVFDRVHKLLKDRHPLYLSLPNWIAIERHCQESSSEYLGAQEWDANTYVEGSHGTVLMEYIPPQHSKPGLYKIKNSHGEMGGSFGQKGYILIEDKVFRAMNVRDALIASKIDWKEEALRLKTQIHQLNEHLSFYRNLATSKGIQKLETSKVMERMKMEAKENIENLKKQLAEAKQNICLPDSPVRKRCGATSMSVAMSIWEESNKSLWKGIEHGNLRITEFTKKEDFDRAHKLLKDGYPLLLRFKRAEWDVIQKYIDESSREYLGSDDLKRMRYQTEGNALVVTKYIQPKDGKPGLYKIKTSHGEYADEPGQKRCILIEEKMLRDFNIASVRVEIPEEEFRDIERGGGT